MTQGGFLLLVAMHLFLVASCFYYVTKVSNTLLLLHITLVLSRSYARALLAIPKCIQPPGEQNDDSIGYRLKGPVLFLVACSMS